MSGGRPQTFDYYNEEQKGSGLDHDRQCIRDISCNIRFRLLRLLQSHCNYQKLLLDKDSIFLIIDILT